jgi:hypothetical protein
MTRSNRLLGVLVLGLVVVAGGGGVAGAAGVERIDPSATLRTYDRVEWRIDVAGRSFTNPFDPDDIAIDATLVGPDGSTRTVPGFWHEPPPRPGEPTTTLSRRGEFRVRFAPHLAGAWRGTVSVRDRGGAARLGEVSFDVAAGTSRGFVRRAPNDRAFQFDDGTSYPLIGINLAWSPDGLRPEWYRAWFAKLQANGANFARLWMCHHSGFVEHAEAGVGRYRAVPLAAYDEILALAEQHGVAVMLCFLNHREFLMQDRWGVAEWPVSPYNAANGGPATTPAEFFTHPEARRMFKNRLRYLVARYGAFTSVAFWELFNEQEYAEVTVPDDWNAEMAAYLRDVDPYRHLITTSANVPDAVWQLPEMDLVQSHLYGDGSPGDVVATIAWRLRGDQRFGKPVYLAELGIDFKGTDVTFDPRGEGTNFHNGLWASVLSGSVGPAGYWWWDSYIEPNQLERRFRPIATFMGKVDWARADLRPIDLPPPLNPAAGEETFGDAVLATDGMWRRSGGQTITVNRAGRTSGPVPAFLFGPAKQELRMPTTLELDLPRDGELKLHVTDVSDAAAIRVRVDDKPAADFFFSALPGSSPDQTSSEFKPQYDNIYQAAFDAVRTVPLKAGRRVVTIDNVGGDWVKLRAIEVTGIRSSRYATLNVLALQDARDGQTLAWLHDPRSTWHDDRDGHVPQPQRGLVLSVPVPGGAAFDVEWFDTRSGETVATASLAPQQGVLKLDVPTFTRDLALRIAPRR